MAVVMDKSSLPSLFQAQWRSNPDPDALPFPRANPPFALTPTDWHQLSLSDRDFTPHSWTSLQHLIGSQQLEALKRWPSALKAYLAWTGHVKSKYGGVTPYLLAQRLFWEPVVLADDDNDDDANKTGALVFDVHDSTPFADSRDYAILRNDWAYGVERGIVHVVVWLKQRLPVDEQGALSEQGKGMVEAFVKREFRERVGEGKGEEGSRVLWFKNTTDLQSVRGLEHVHVLLRGVDEGVLERWMG